jgi:hypothetical protein
VKSKPGEGSTFTLYLPLDYVEASTALALVAQPASHIPVRRV